MLYQIAKGIIKTTLNFIDFLFLKVKNYLTFGFVQSKERIFHPLNSAEFVFVFVFCCFFFLYLEISKFNRNFKD